MIRSTNRLVLTRLVLSTAKTEACGISSASSTATSEGMPRRLRVAGTANTWCSTSHASLRVTTRYGRRPASGCSYHHTSPRATTEAAPQRPLRHPDAEASLSSRHQPTDRGRPIHLAGSAGFAGSPQRSGDRRPRWTLGKVSLDRLPHQGRSRNATCGRLGVQLFQEPIVQLHNGLGAGHWVIIWQAPQLKQATTVHHRGTPKPDHYEGVTSQSRTRWTRCTVICMVHPLNSLPAQCPTESRR